MNTKVGSKILKIVKKSVFSICIALLATCNVAHAVLINFDDLDPNAYSYEGGNPYLTNEYESQGLVFENAAYLLEWSGSTPSVSAPNYVGGPGFGFKFVGELPTSVSFYLGSSSHMAVIIDAFGPNYASHIISSGEAHGMTEEGYTPYIPNEIFSFYSVTGISSIEFSGRGDVNIDDLTYNYSPSVQVPEPSAFILFLIGFLGLMTPRLKIAINLVAICFNRRSL